MPFRWWSVAMAAALFAVPLARAQEPIRVSAQGVYLDFQDADLRLVIAALAEAGKLNVLYGELPARRVTMRTTVPVPVQSIPALLKSLAQTHGLKVIEEGDFLRLESIAGGGAGAAAVQRDSATAAGSEVRLFVYKLRHARAARLAGTIQSLFGGTARSPGLAEVGPTSLSQELAANRLAPRDTGAIRVDATVGPVRLSLPGRLKGEIQVVPDEATNALLVRSERGDWEIIRTAIEALDLRPLQVLIEVLIAEVRLTKERSTGFAFDAKGKSGGTIRGNLAGDNVGGLTLGLLTKGKVTLEAALSALASRGEVRILSRPSVLAQNNQEARILIGSERPFVQVFRSLPTDAGIRDQIVQYRDVGTKLTITPTINDDHYINLQVVQEVSTATAETQFGAPVISTREAATHLFVKDGQTVVLGGLIENQRERTRSGVPFLKDIPVLGVFFGSTKDSDIQSELFLFLTTHVVETDEDAELLRQGVEQSSVLLRKLLPANQTFPVVKPPAPTPPDQPPVKP